jgi:hypothetical protein
LRASGREERAENTHKTQNPDYSQMSVNVVFF